MRQAIQIQIFDGNKALVTETFDQNKIVIGRILSADLRVPDTRISRIHALLERTEDGGLRLTDLASSHGTTVNGQKIIEKIVGPADHIELAGLKLQLQFVRIEEEVSAEAPIEKTERLQVQEKSSKRAEVHAQPQVEREAPRTVDTGGSPGPKVARDPTVIRSLKETAKNRGALDPARFAHETLELTVYWEETILNVEHIRGYNRIVKIGATEQNDYIVPSNVIPDSYSFLHVRGSSAEVHLHPSMTGSVRLNGEMQTLESLQKAGRSTLTIQGNDIAKIQIGTVNFFLMFVANPPRVNRDRLFDQGPLIWFLTAVFSAITLLGVFIASQYEKPIEGTVTEYPERVRKIIVQAYKKQTLPPVVGTKAQQGVSIPGATLGEKAEQAKGEEGEGSRAQGREGKSGRPDAERPTGGINNIPNKNPDNKRARPVRLPIKENPKTLLESLKMSGLGSKITKGSGSTTGSSLSEAFQGVGGNSGNSQGNGGLGLQGTGTGGGNTVAGVGGLGTKGFGTGAKGTGQNTVTGKGEASVGTETLSIIVLGGLSREEIMRVVESHNREVLNCYQRAVQMEPGLSGKLELMWQIADGGRVQNVKVQSNTTGSASLAKCVQERVQTWKFPSPPPGSVADVTWPWAMKPPGR